MGVPIARSHAAGARTTGGTSIHAGFVASEVLLLALLAALSVAARNHHGPFPGDVGFERDVQAALFPQHWLVGPLEAVSTLNWPIPTAITLGIIVLLFLLLRRWLDAIIIPLAAGVASMATLFLSRWVARPRPSGHGIHILQKITSTYSYPSGHMEYAVAIFGLFIVLTFGIRRAVHPALIWVIRAVLVALIVLMPVSRMLEGEHWPSDLLGGTLDGLFWLVLFAHLYFWARSRWPRLLAHDER
ncbi:MAG: hypothetical protein PVSMB7_27460 [Chloroflexota bacterium]